VRFANGRRPSCSSAKRPSSAISSARAVSTPQPVPAPGDQQFVGIGELPDVTAAPVRGRFPGAEARVERQPRPELIRPTLIRSTGGNSVFARRRSVVNHWRRVECDDHEACCPMHNSAHGQSSGISRASVSAHSRSVANGRQRRMLDHVVDERRQRRHRAPLRRPRERRLPCHLRLELDDAHRMTRLLGDRARQDR
jgi:hypothetical protein